VATFYIDAAWGGPFNGTETEPYAVAPVLTAGNTYLFKGGGTYQQAANLNLNAAGITLGTYGTGVSALGAATVSDKTVRTALGADNATIQDLTIDAADGLANHVIQGGGSRHTVQRVILRGIGATAAVDAISAGINFFGTGYTITDADISGTVAGMQLQTTEPAISPEPWAEIARTVIHDLEPTPSQFGNSDGVFISTALPETWHDFQYRLKIHHNDWSGWAENGLDLSKCSHVEVCQNKLGPSLPGLTNPIPNILMSGPGIGVAPTFPTEHRFWGNFLRQDDPTYAQMAPRTGSGDWWVSSIVIGGARAYGNFGMNDDLSNWVCNGLFKNQAQAAVRFSGGQTTQQFVYNTIFLNAGEAEIRVSVGTPCTHGRNIVVGPSFRTSIVDTGTFTQDGADIVVPDIAALMLTDPDNDNYRPLPGSPCIGAGKKWWGNAPRPRDQDGEPYPDVRPDIGPYQTLYDPGHPARLLGAPIVIPVPGNQRPVFDGPDIGDLVLTENVAMTAIDVGARFSDPDMDSLTHASVGTALPAGITYINGVLSGTPTAVAVTTGYVMQAADPEPLTSNSDTFGITVSAAPPVSDSEYWSDEYWHPNYWHPDYWGGGVQASNQAPAWSSIPAHQFTQGVASVYNLSSYISDPESDSLTFAEVSSVLPSNGVTLNTLVPSLVYDGVGAVSTLGNIVISANDGTNPAVNSGNIVVTIAAAVAGDWASRSTEAGVTMRTNFDVSDDVFDFTPQAPSNYEWEQTIKKSGGGALKILIPNTDGTSGWNWWRFLSDDMEPFGSVESGLIDEYYLTYSVYIPQEYYNWIFSMSPTAHKKFSICAKQPSNTVNPVTRAALDFTGYSRRGSSVKNEVVVNDYEQRMHPMVYVQSRGDSARAFEFDNSPVNFDFQYQNAVDEGVKTGTPIAHPTDARSQSLRNLVAQSGPHKNYAADPTQGQSRFDDAIPHPDPIAAGKHWRPGWNNVQLRVKFPTTWLGTDGLLEFLIHHDGDRDWTKLISSTGTHPTDPFLLDDPEETSADIPNVPWNGGVDGWYHLGVWLTPFRTAGVAEPSRPNTYLVYDDVICSTNSIVPPTSVPTWHPADNQMLHITGAGKSLVDVEDPNKVVASNDNAGGGAGVVNSWTTMTTAPDGCGFVAQGGHNGGADNAIYWLENFLGASAPDWARISDADPAAVYAACGLPNGKPNATHGYNTDGYIPGIGPYKMGLPAIWSPNGDDCNDYVTWDRQTDTWTLRNGSLATGSDLASIYDPVHHKIFHIDRSDTGSQSLWEVNPDTGAQTQRAPVGTAYDSIEVSLTCDWNRNIILMRSASTPTVYRVWDSANPSTASIVPNIPSFPLLGSGRDASVSFVSTLGTMGKFVIWDGGNSFYTLEPSADPFGSDPWRVATITVATPNGTPTQPSTGWFRKMTWVSEGNIFVCVDHKNTGYWITRLVD